jgi:hypothetical protein
MRVQSSMVGSWWVFIVLLRVATKGTTNKGNHMIFLRTKEFIKYQLKKYYLDIIYPQHYPQRNNRSKFKKEFILISELFLSKD